MPLKDDLRNGKGEFNYFTDWLEKQGDGAPDLKGMKSMILAVLEDEIESRVGQKVDASIAAFKKDAVSVIEGKIAFMETSIKMMHADKGAKLDGVMGEIAKLVAEVGKIKSAPAPAPVVQQKPVQQVVAPRASVAYSADIVRGSDGLISKINLTPKG